MLGAVGFFREEKAQGEWSSVYFLLVLVIVALVLIAFIKPMFQGSQEIVTRTAGNIGK